MAGDTEGKIFKEISSSLCRYLKRTGRLKVKDCYIVYFTSKSLHILLCDWKGNEKNIEEKETGDIICELFSSPRPIYIVGFESDPHKNDRAILGDPGYEPATKFRFFYKVFPELVGYVSVPFDPEHLMVRDSGGMLEEGRGLEEVLESVFKSLSSHIDEIKSLGWKNWKDAFVTLGRYLGVSIEERQRFVHGTKNQGKISFLIQLANMFAGIIRLKLALGGGGNRIKLLLIDNKPDQELVEIDERLGFLKNVKLKDVLRLFSPVIESYIFDGKQDQGDFRWLLGELKNRKGTERPLTLPCKCVKRSEIGNRALEEKKIEDFDAILVDMHLGDGQPDGLEILYQLTEVYPEIPAFVLSVSDDFALIRRANKSGADYYIIKNQVFSVPYVLWDYLKSMGELLEWIEDRERRRNLLGNIRYWHFKKRLLWFGDKCYHMIDHSFEHTLDDWKHMNEVLVPLIACRGKKIFKDLGKELTDELLYSLCMAVWLHDIGHKGDCICGDPHLIRDNHGCISGRLILKHPYLFRILDGDDYYRDIDFSKVSAVEAIYRRKNKQGLTVTEMIALLSIYHKSNAPLDQEGFHTLYGRKKIPREYYLGRNPGYNNILTLERVLEERDSEVKERFLRLAALLRFVDGLDIRAVRVGDFTERELKKVVIENDKHYLYRKIAREVKDLSHHYTYTPAESALFVKTFYDDVIDRIEKGELISLKLSEDFVKDPEVLEDYEALTDYAAFIALQPDHFDLHSSVKKISFSYLSDDHLCITLLTDKSEDWLKDEARMVKERGKKIQTIYDRLIGKDNYIFKESESGRRYLKSFFSRVTLILKHENDEFEPVCREWML